MRLHLVLIILSGAAFSLLRADETLLFNGKDLTGWQEPHGSWTVAATVTLNPKDPKSFVLARPGEGIFFNTTSGKGVNLLGKMPHGDCSLHVEFTVPKDSNSG